jgi:UDP-glucose 4-epimerase
MARRERPAWTPVASDPRVAIARNPLSRAFTRAGGKALTRVLITGAGGYVGSGLVGDMREAGWDVRAAVRHRADHLPVEQIVTELGEDPADAARACEGMDAVVHLAGDNEVLAAHDPARALRATVLATERLVQAAAAAGVKRFVYMSTMHVYGERIKGGATLTEDLRPEPRAVYAIARLASEHISAALSSAGVEVVILRLTNSLGAPAHPAVDRWTLVANDLCRQGVLTGRLELRSSGVQWRDFIALSDVRASVSAACRLNPAVLPAGTYNLGSGQPLTIRGLAGLVQDSFERCTGTRPQLHAPEPSPERPEPYYVSVDRAASHGLKAETPVADAVEDTVRFCIEHKEALAG